jgi:hypothetical protein
MNSIFVQIASYRDKELLPTLRDLFSKSSGENHITVGLVWQKDDTETIEEFSNDSRVRIISCDWAESKGLGWARSLTQSLYQDEDFTLQLDSHHRFIPNWDKLLIECYNSLLGQSSKPFLTSYAAGYDPNNDQHLLQYACKVLPIDFKSSGTIWFNPVRLDASETNRPIRARLVSGHYFFTGGSHCKEYLYDPDLYFAGDEICLSARSYTLGYDLYHPNVNFVWHHYGRYDRNKHWGDHTDSVKNKGVVEKTWNERDDYSKRRIRQLLGEEDYGIDLGKYGLGNVRTLKDYETYCGFDFKNRRIHKCAIRGLEPPITFSDPVTYSNEFKKYINVNITSLNKEKFLEYSSRISSMSIEFFNLQRNMIHTQHINPVNFLQQNTFSTIVVSDNEPMRYRITAMDKMLNTIYSYENDMRPNIHWN